MSKHVLASVLASVPAEVSDLVTEQVMEVLVRCIDSNDCYVVSQMRGRVYSLYYQCNQHQD